MNIIIVGCGKVGQKITEMLSYEKEHNITVIDHRYSVVSHLANEYDIMGVEGSGTSIDTLTEAGIENADILIAVTGSDEINLITCLIAKKAGNCQTIARVRKPEFGKEIALLKDDLGLAMVINPELAAATEIARVLKFPSAIQIDTFAKGRVELLKFKIPESSPLDNLKISDLSAKLDCDVLVCGIERGEEAVIPRGDFVLKQGDKISIVGAFANVTDFFKKIGFKPHNIKDTTIVGGGETAYYLAKILQQSAFNVKIIEKDSNRCDELCRLLPKTTIINGDGTDTRVLMEEGLEYAGSFVSLINIDEENIMLSLFAKSKTNAKVITKINRIAYDEVISGLDLDTIIYPKNITAEYIVRFVRAKNNSVGSNIETMHFVLDGKAEALEFKIEKDSPVANVALEELTLKDNVLVACINRGRRIIIPRGKDVMQPGDTVVVVTVSSGFKDISDILK
ncbi:MAG: Trk system potassium transporter TrkA [Clostridia bacterium]|nr:Trk system potassium transporter TrkA [Clostridia bacterium]